MVCCESLLEEDDSALDDVEQLVTANAGDTKVATNGEKDEVEVNTNAVDVERKNRGKSRTNVVVIRVMSFSNVLHLRTINYQKRYQKKIARTTQMYYTAIIPYRTALSQTFTLFVRYYVHLNIVTSISSKNIHSSDFKRYRTVRK